MILLAGHMTTPGKIGTTICMENLKEIFDLEYFFHLSPDWLCVAGFDGYFKKINPAVSRTLGYTEVELFAKPIDSFVYPEDRSITASKRESIKKNNPLYNFENRYVTKSGEIVWLSWTSMPVKSQELVFAIAKNITDKKKLEEFSRTSLVSAQNSEILKGGDLTRTHLLKPISELSIADQLWLYELETLVRKYIGKVDLGIVLLSSEMGLSERQLHRRIKNTTGVTPNNYIRRIRLQMSMEAINSGKYRTVAEISYIAGFETPAYFRKLFKEFYGRDVAELLQ
ncbi:PAS domain S-box-containing protein [Mucilaginibacter gossypiicola]|uniref:PAS domain S-box-containing protein n=2 Tax=Mucilaginibacter gossypiicola TaxID=551995 RepID=A0A1H8RBU3_9SPHI|nr:PAS domain S-box-containing protein [Mucilaginibacter gossypiicola]